MKAKLLGFWSKVRKPRFARKTDNQPNVLRSHSKLSNKEGRGRGRGFCPTPLDGQAQHASRYL